MHIGRRCVECVTAPRAVPHLASKRYIVTEQFAGMGDVMRSERRPNPRARNTCAIRLHCRQSLQTETRLSRKTRQQGKITAPAKAEAEIVAHQQKTQPQR